MGYFGKIPSARDFIFQGLPTRTTVVWADHMAGWIAAGRRASESWKTLFLTSPVWRFVVPGGLLGPQGWTGLLAGSVDEVGREFPFTVMIETGLDPGFQQPTANLDPAFDRIEGRMLEFIEGHADEAALLTAIEGAETDLRKAAPAESSGASSRTLVLPPGDDDAVCVQGHRVGPLASHPGTAYTWSSASGSLTPAALCLWWHDGGRTRAAETCVTRGIPDPRCVPPFFLGEWARHGWIRSDGDRRPDRR